MTQRRRIAPAPTASPRWRATLDAEIDRQRAGRPAAARSRRWSTRRSRRCAPTPGCRWRRSRRRSATREELQQPERGQGGHRSRRLRAVLLAQPAAVSGATARRRGVARATSTSGSTSIGATSCSASRGSRRRRWSRPSSSSSCARWNGGFASRWSRWRRASIEVDTPQRSGTGARAGSRALRRGWRWRTTRSGPSSSSSPAASSRRSARASRRRRSARCSRAAG